jgi:hypothetical protein
MALQCIWNAVDNKSLGRLLSGVGRQFRRLGFNFSAFGLEDDCACRGPRTIKVRFLEGCGAGTEGKHEVTGWIKIFIAFVSLAVKGSQARFEKALLALKEEAVTKGKMQDESRGDRFAGQLKMIGVEEEVIALFTRMVRRNYPPHC